MGHLKALTDMPLSAAEAADLKQQIFTAARRMTNDQVLDLADALHDIIRARQVVRRSISAERRSFSAEA